MSNTLVELDVKVKSIESALLIATGCCIYPNGWSSREIRDVCGPDSEAYRLVTGGFNVSNDSHRRSSFIFMQTAFEFLPITINVLINLSNTIIDYTFARNLSDFQCKLYVNHFSYHRPIAHALTLQHRLSGELATSEASDTKHMAVSVAVIALKIKRRKKVYRISYRQSGDSWEFYGFPPVKYRKVNQGK
ncbi:hypothetical protein CEXT_103491 [Caerostris extrusa]|uniref:Uncharacterized protein n=1 Tax=Caerostris extrusa TaxID=172846 RepID=A0AAV4QZ76_CAEEX|nr:hypothetical protein CEXT_103491 [Caerostris extrusa]